MRHLVVFAAPHRLLFLTGMVQLLAALAWWVCALLDLKGVGPGLPVTAPPYMLHAPVLLLLVLPPFFFGFLLTVFPRWIGFPDSTPIAYVPVGVAFLLAAIFLWSGVLAGNPPVVITAFRFAAVGWVWAMLFMARLLFLELRADKAPTWHAWSAFAALSVGLACLAAIIQGLRLSNGLLVHVASIVGLFLVVLPIFVTVCHRMVPFFAGNVVEDYRRWRPFWVLAAYWLASAAVSVAYLNASRPVVVASNATLAGLTGLMLWKWWPRSKAPGLLWVLILGFAWAPVGFFWAALAGLFSSGSNLGAIHALTIGFACSLLVAMVTRVTQGHAGRPLFMPAVAWLAFFGVQVSVLLRLAAAVSGEALSLLIASALCLTIGFAPWGLRAIAIYISPRADGRPG